MSHAHEEDIWPEREVDHEREQDFGQYDSYPEIYKGNLTEEGDDSPYAYNEGLFEDTWEEPPYRGEDLMPRNREWHDDREFPNTQDCRNQGTVRVINILFLLTMLVHCQVGRL